MLPANGHKVVQSLQRSFFVASRSFASAPLTDPLEDEDVIPARKANQSDVQVTKLDNGIKVASCDNGGPLTRVVVAIQAGSRFENKNQLGLTHVLKNAAFLTNGGRSHLRTVRETQQTGGFLECTSSRELVSRNAAFCRLALPEMMENIAPAITSPLFNKWELSQVLARCKGDLATLDGTAVNLEHLHKVAFRDGLGNSIYCSNLKLGSYAADDLAAFANQHHVGGSVTVVGTDCDHDELVRYSRDLLGGLPGGAPATTAQQYHGGEAHMSTSNGFTYASFAGAGAGLSSADLPAFAVLQRILGYGKCIKWGSNTVSSRLNRAAEAATQDPCSLTAMNISYSDAGLFGIHAVATPGSIGTVLRAAVGEITNISSGDLSAEEVERAKYQVKANIMMLSEGNEDLIDDLVKQVVFTNGYATPAATLKKIDAVSLEQVVEASKQVLSGKSTLVVTGDVSHATYLDELL